MNLDFTPDKNALYIPKEVYQPKKRCPFCQSYFITDFNCESCGRNLNFNLLGEPFSFKSFRGLMEKYIQQQDFIVRLFPLFENKNSLVAQSYKRNLIKRFKDVLIGLSSFNLIEEKNRILFFNEAKDLALELIEYGEKKESLIFLMEAELGENILIQHLGQYLNSLVNLNSPNKHWTYQVLEMKLFGLLRIEFILKFSILMAAILFTAIKFRFFLVS